MAETWRRLNPGARVHIAYGGTRERFAEISWPDRTFIEDTRLRTRDHQRDRQSYLGLMRAVAADLQPLKIDRVLMAECDVMPLRAGLVDYLEKRRREESADLLGPRIRRVDGTGHPHYLAHRHHPAFEQWMAQSVRKEKGTVLMMVGCLTWWTWEAFEAVSSSTEPMPVYLELAIPTAAHQLGFRVRELTELNSFLQPLGEMQPHLTAWRASGHWVAHPCKKIWSRDTPS